MFNGGDTNLYGYVLNDPINYIDPSGLIGLVDQDAADAGFGFMSSSYYFIKNYLNMTRNGVIGGDLYYHCMANCQSASVSNSGVSFSTIFSNTREYAQEYGTGQCSLDSANDQFANQHGRGIGKNGGSCYQSCLNLVPGAGSRNLLMGR